MSKIIFYLVFCLEIMTGPLLFCQEYKKFEDLIWDFMIGDTDIVFMDDKRYLINKSFLINFNGYKNLYPEIEKVEAQLMTGSGSQDYDMTYTPYWLIQNDSIYLIGISLNTDGGIVKNGVLVYDYQLPAERFLRMEKFVNKRFEKGDIPQSCTKLIRRGYSIGTMFASWINGVYLIKQTKEFSQSDSEWYKAPIFKLTIKNGKIIKIEKIEI